MTEEKIRDLLRSARLHLAITWADEELDRKLTEQIRRGVSYLSWLGAGNAGLSFDVGSEERRLLMEYLLFAHNGREHEFTTVYERDLNTYQLTEEAKEYARSSKPDV